VSEELGILLLPVQILHVGMALAVLSGVVAQLRQVRVAGDR
jgi:hypothetical protein